MGAAGTQSPSISPFKKIDITEFSAVAEIEITGVEGNFSFELDEVDEKLLDFNVAPDGVTYDTTAGDYAYTSFTKDDGTGSPANSTSSASDTKIRTDFASRIKADVIFMADATRNTTLHYVTFTANGANTIEIGHGCGARVTNQAETALKIDPTSATFSGKITVWETA